MKKTVKRRMPPKPYDSWFEYRLHQTPLKGWDHHPERIEYSIPRTYEADFTRKIGNTTYLVESKGYFRNSDEAKKYLYIQKSLPKDTELVFVLENEKVPLHFRNKRKNGTKITISEFLDKNNIKWYNEYNLPREWNNA